MATLRTIAIHWYRKVFGAPPGSDIREEGLSTVLDGNSAVALAEAGISGHAVLGGTFPSTDAEMVWRGEIDHGNTNLYGEALAAQSAEGPRGIVAASMASLFRLNLEGKGVVSDPAFVETFTYSVIVSTIVLQGLTGRQITDIARHALPYFVLMAVAIVLLYLIPGLVTWLPAQMVGP